MKKILISAKDLKIGGIEKSLIRIIKFLIEHGYTVTLVLEKKTGELLKELDSGAKILEYMPCSIKFMPLRKIINFWKRINFEIRNRNKFDVSISYTTYSKMCSFVARVASKRSILWCHADYLELFEKDKKKTKAFFKELGYNKFSKIVFVSNTAKKHFLEVFPGYKNVYFCNNLIDENEIVEKSNEPIELRYNNEINKNEITTFLNVSRHDEKQKRLSRIIDSAKRLKEEGYKFRIIFIGDGKEHNEYAEKIEKYNLEKEIILLGLKENPYPYFKISDCIILSSDYEGYPVVFLEAYILNKSIITTKISDYEDIKKGRGIVTEKTNDGIYNAMKYFLENGYEIEEKFDGREYYVKIEEKLCEILEKF